MYVNKFYHAYQNFYIAPQMKNSEGLGASNGTQIAKKVLVTTYYGTQFSIHFFFVYEISIS